MLMQVVSSVPVEVLTVKQERGTDSIVKVFEEWHQDYPRDRKVLRFISDQSLNVNSDRAYNVLKAIENYAKPRGFDTNRIKPDKNELTVSYDPGFHAAMAEFQVRTQIQADPRYQAKVSEAEQRRDAINREYGIAIRQLKNLVFALENRNRQELDILKRELIATQIEVLQDIEIPEVIDEQHRKRLFEPNYPIAKMDMDSYAEYGQRGKLPTDLASILALLD